MRPLVASLTPAGYHSIGYALRYPQRVRGLILVSPAGLTSRENPIDWTGSRFEPPTGPPRTLEDKGLAYDLLHFVWRQLNVTPLHVVRWPIVKPITPLLVARFMRDRFPKSNQVRQDARYRYAYALCAQPAGSTFSLTQLLGPGAVPVLPLLPRMGPLAGKVSMSLIRGTEDWLPSINAEVAGRLGATYRELPGAGRT